MDTATASSASPDPLPADPLRAELEPFAAVLCGDGRRRCPWSVAGRGVLVDHDTAWARTPEDADGYFAALCLELFDSGLARWSQSGRHPSWYLHLAQLCPGLVARLDEDDVEDLLLNPELIRNRAKLESVIHNARVCREWRLADWRELLREAEVPPVGAAPYSSLELMEYTAPAQRLARRLREHGLRLVGPVTAHRWLQRTGHAAAHVRGCFRLGQAPEAP